jgi:haloalkane dehalogenase
MLALSSDFRCICLDAPGTGLSGRPPERLSLELSAAAVVNVLEQLDLSRVTLVCHDLGGISGFAGAARESHRVERLVAVNALAWRPHTWSLRSALAVFGSAAIREADALTHLVPRITSTTFGIGRHLDPPSRRVFLESFDRDRIRAFHAYLRDALRCDALYAEIERAIDGPLAALPLQTIFGERNDPFHFQEQWRARYPDVVRCVLGHGNHFPMCDDPPRVAAWIRDRHRATRSSTVAAGTI